MWTVEMDAMLRQLHDQQLPFTVIAERMRLTKNKVVGRAYRLKLPQRRDPSARKTEGKFSGKKSHGKAFKIQLSKKPPKMPKDDSAGIAALIAIPTSNFLSRDPGICKWPHGDCEQKATRHAYCDEHHKRSRASA